MGVAPERQKRKKKKKNGSSLLTQGVKDPALSLLCLRFAQELPRASGTAKKIKNKDTRNKNVYDDCFVQIIGARRVFVLLSLL